MFIYFFVFFPDMSLPTTCSAIHAVHLGTLGLKTIGWEIFKPLLGWQKVPKTSLTTAGGCFLQRSFIKTYSFFFFFFCHQAEPQRHSHFPPIKLCDSVESYGINCLLIRQVCCEDSGCQKALDHSIYYQADLISTAR